MKVLQGTRQKSSRNFGIRLAVLRTECDTNPRIHANDANEEELSSCYSFPIRNWCRVPRGARSQLKYAWQLFIKNTAPCELARGCIGGDT